MPVRATVLVALDENRLAACDQKARRRIAREIVVHGEVQTSVRDARLSDPHEARGRRRLVNEPAPKDLVEMAVGAHAPSSTPVVRGGAFRVAHACTERLRVGATRGEARQRLSTSAQRIARRCRR